LRRQLRDLEHALRLGHLVEYLVGVVIELVGPQTLRQDTGAAHQSGQHESVHGVTLPWQSGNSRSQRFFRRAVPALGSLAGACLVSRDAESAQRSALSFNALRCADSASRLTRTRSAAQTPRRG